MNIDKILNNPLINQAEVARQMFPGNSNPRQYLYKKIHNKERQSLSFKDKEKIKKIIEDLFADIK